MLNRHREPPPTDSQQSKSIRSLIRNISSGLPTSPILGRKQQQQAAFQAGLRNSEETNIPGGSFSQIYQDKMGERAVLNAKFLTVFVNKKYKSAELCISSNMNV